MRTPRHTVVISASHQQTVCNFHLQHFQLSPQLDYLLFSLTKHTPVQCAPGDSVSVRQLTGLAYSPRDSVSVRRDAQRQRHSSARAVRPLKQVHTVLNNPTHTSILSY